MYKSIGTILIAIISSLYCTSPAYAEHLNFSLSGNRFWNPTVAQTNVGLFEGRSKYALKGDISYHFGKEHGLLAGIGYGRAKHKYFYNVVDDKYFSDYQYFFTQIGYWIRLKGNTSTTVMILGNYGSGAFYFNKLNLPSKKLSKTKMASLFVKLQYHINSGSSAEAVVFLGGGVSRAFVSSFTYNGILFHPGDFESQYFFLFGIGIDFIKS